MSVEQPLPSRARRWLALTATLSLLAVAPAQTLVSYGGYRSGSIDVAGQSNRYFLQGAHAGDTLRISFCSQYTGYPCYCYHHRLDVTDGTSSIGSGIDGCGVLTVPLTATATLTITVRARNNQSAGWYALQVDRMNSPVGADRVAFNWTMSGSITAAAAFATYTLRGEAGSSAILRHTSQYTGYPCYCYHHYAELVDDVGTRVTAVDGDGAAAFTFPTSGIYTLFIAAGDHAKTGSYATSVDCQSWPVVPCDTVPYAGNYCKGLAGTNGVPALTASPAPALGSAIAVTMGNSAGVPTAAVLLIGIDALNLPFLGGTLCVADPTILTIPNLPMAGTSFGIAIPNDPLLVGFGFALQSLVFDAGAPQSVAFSRGLVLIPG